MAMTLRLNDEETAALKRQAESEHRSMQEVARLAIAERVNRSERSNLMREIASEILVRDAQALKRLGE
jgi:predicted transcriptional regulator